MLRCLVLVVAIAFSCLAAGCTSRPASDPLAWPDVEQTHRPWTRWWWLGNAVDPPALTTLLESYRAAGLGGVEITPIYGARGAEEQFIDYLSPEWMAMLAHTADEAERLNLGVDMATGTGWPFGGPQVELTHAAKQVRVATFTVEGGASLTEPLQMQDPRTEQPAPLVVLMAYGSAGTRLDLTDRVGPDGTLAWTAPDDQTWTLIALFQGWTGQQVKRAAPGGEGYVIDHFDRDAFADYIARFDTAFAPYEDRLIRAFFNDSFEAYGSNWTTDFLDRFEALRDYDLRDHLPALLRADTVAAEHVGRVTADYQATMAELLRDQFTRPWVAWAHERGSIARNQAHGSPGNLVDLYAAVDIPETETFNPDSFAIPGYRLNPEYAAREDRTDPLVLKFASSAAHLTGKPRTSAETATWLGEHFTVSLSQIKPTVDKLFISGINHIVYHGTPYSPPGADWPGWLFYASTHVAPTNTFWRDLPALNTYITRVQSVLQTSQPDSDVLVYFPIHDVRQASDRTFFQFTVHNADEWLYDTPLHEVAQHLHRRGYAFDYISDQLLEDTDAEADQLQVGASAYDVLLVPASAMMPVATLTQLLDLAERGATVLVHRRLPHDVPGFGRLAERRAALQQQLARLDADTTYTSGLQTIPIGNGRVLIGADVGALLNAVEVAREPAVEQDIAFIRRTHDGGHHYFLTHVGTEAVAAWIPLSIEARSAAFLDPLTGGAGQAALRQRADGAAEVYLQLEPGQSLILRTFADQPITGAPAWPYVEPAGPAHPLTGPWQVSFIDGGPSRPPDATLDSLVSWTDLGDASYDWFAGTARYTLTFEPPDLEADAWRLDLGRVAESAAVRLNGRPLGTAFSLPFQLHIDSLAAGTNVLELDVTNLMANRIAYLDRRGVEWQRFYDINFVNLAYQRFDASGWDPLPSGLIGPVRLVPLHRRPPE